jgi:hypothetical protein
MAVLCSAISAFADRVRMTDPLQQPKVILRLHHATLLAGGPDRRSRFKMVAVSSRKAVQALDRT